MAKTDFQSADEYIATLPEPIQAVLQTVRQAIRDAVPEAEEVISYQIPAFKYHGFVLYYSAYKTHFSLSCPPPWTVFKEFQEELAPYEISKSTIQFPLSDAVPVDLISRMAAFRANENEKQPAPAKGNK